MIHRSLLASVALVAVLHVVSPSSVCCESGTRASLLIQLGDSSEAFAHHVLVGRIREGTATFALPSCDISGDVGVLRPWSSNEIPAGRHELRIRVGDTTIDTFVTLYPDSLTLLVLGGKRPSVIRRRVCLASLDSSGTAPDTASTRPLLGFPVFYDQPPRVIAWTRGPYPKSARKAKVEGTVVMVARLDSTGVITGKELLQSIPLLDMTALKSICGWRFAPARLFGRAIPSQVIIPMRFTLEGPNLCFLGRSN